MHSDLKNTFSQLSQYSLVHQHGNRDMEVSDNVTEMYGGASGLYTHIHV